jgi:hypothetical protein
MGERLRRLRLENLAAQRFDLFLAHAGIDAIARRGGKVDLRPCLTDRGEEFRIGQQCDGIAAVHVLPS